jgi:hypothetical protein
VTQTGPASNERALNRRKAGRLIGKLPAVRKPCSNCPWRRDAPREYWDPLHLKDIWRNCQDDGQNPMLCRKAGDMPPDQAREVICQGWVRVIGLDAVGVRLAAMRGTITPEELEDTDRQDLFDSLEEMMEANAVEMPARNRWAKPGG